MRGFGFRSFVLFCSLWVSLISQADGLAAPPVKDWTLLIFLNGNNNLDRFGKLNLTQLEKVGSTANINIVVQWASLKTKTVKRLLIQKSTDPTQVTSPVIEEVKADMGDWHSVVDFVAWGVRNYPAQHYFLDLWDHGSGWHSKRGSSDRLHDISLDDLTGNQITTQQLGLAMQESAKIMGHKVDLFAMDACLMAMIEIASEVKDSVRVFGASEHLEPGEGWPYDELMIRWNKNPKMSAQELAKIVSEEYVKRYRNQTRQITFSVFDLDFILPLQATLSDLARNLEKLSGPNLRKVINSALDAQTFTKNDYVDLIDFLEQLELARVTNFDPAKISAVKAAVGKMVVQNNESNAPRAHGVSLWVPTNSLVFNKYAATYTQLKFDQETQWSPFLKTLSSAR